MKSLHTLYFLGLLSSATLQVYSYEEELVGLEIKQEVELAQIELETESEQERIERETDQELFELFERFFNESDTMPFSKIISKIAEILKIKKIFLEDHQQARCEELIKTFEKNKYNTNYVFWAKNFKNLVDPELDPLMSQKTRNYIKSISIQKLISALITKLHNNKH